MCNIIFQYEQVTNIARLCKEKLNTKLFQYISKYDNYDLTIQCSVKVMNANFGHNEINAMVRFNIQRE